PCHAISNTCPSSSTWQSELGGMSGLLAPSTSPSSIPIPLQPSRASRLVREAASPLLTQPHQVAAAAPNTHQSQHPLVAQGPSLLYGEWRILLLLSPMHARLQVVAGAWVGGSVALGGHIPPPTSLPSSPFPSRLLGVHLSFVMGSND